MNVLAKSPAAQAFRTAQAEQITAAAYKAAMAKLEREAEDRTFVDRTPGMFRRAVLKIFRGTIYGFALNVLEAAQERDLIGPEAAEQISSVVERRLWPEGRLPGV